MISTGPCAANCSVLVFGVGGDSPLWASANRHGRTVFIEDSAEWAERVAERSPELEVHLVEYRTRVARLAREVDAFNEKLWQFLPKELEHQPWSVFLIDAPMGFGPDRPGRLQPAWYAYRNIAHHHGLDVDVFLHDFERRGEQVIGT